MRILALVDFKHGRTQFAAGIRYELPERLGGYVCGSGWARELPADDAQAHITPPVEELGADAPRPAAANVTLAVDDVAIGHAAQSAEG